MIKYLMLLLVLYVPTENPNVFRSRVDKIEANTYYDYLGFPQFTQIIYYEWIKVKGKPCFVVRSWHLNKHVWKKDKLPEDYENMLEEDQRKYWSEHKKKWMEAYEKLCNENHHYIWRQREDRYRRYDPEWTHWPQKNYNTGMWSIRHITSDRVVIVESPIFVETHTQVDNERANRDILAEDKRNPVHGFSVAVNNGQSFCGCRDCVISRKKFLDKIEE